MTTPHDAHDLPPPPAGHARLLRTRRFLPLLVTQTLGALNDNLFKNALVVLALFQAAEHGGPVLVALSGGVFILPYVALSALAGQLADRGEKSRLIRVTKLFEIALMALAATGFLTGNLALLMVVLFGLGVQATFFSPLKYAILPDHLREAELVAGNGLIEAGTFLGILAGTIAGGALMLLDGGGAVVSAVGLAVALAGFAASLGVPAAPAADPTLRLGWNLPRETLTLLGEARGNRPVWLAILGLSWFWTIGATLLAAFPVIAKETLAGGGSVVTLLLTVFAVGVGVGSIACAKILRGEVSPRLVPWAALGITLFTADFAFAALAGVGDPRLATAGGVLAAPVGWRMLADLFLLAACGGLYSVPLYAIVQEWSPPALRARMIAANNVANAAWMAIGAGTAAALTAIAVPPPHVLLIAAAVNLAVTIRIAGTIPHETVRAALRLYLRIFHRFEVRGIEHYRAAGENAILVVNHLSLADGALVAAAVPDRPSFVANLFIARKWWARPLLALVRTFEVDPTSPYAFKAMVRAVREEGRKLVIFPEGRISRTGALMKIYDGAGMLAERTGAPVVPVRLDGPQYSRLAYSKGVLRRRWFPRLTVTFLPPVRIETPEGVHGRARRRALSDALDSVMAEAAFRTVDTGKSLFAALLDARAHHGGGAEVLDDPEEYNPLSYDRTILGAMVLGRRLAAITAPGERVGVMLPNAKGTAVTFFALQAFGRVPAMLNFSAGADAMLGACRAAEVRTVLCSRRFVERAKLGAVATRMEGAVRFVWLEDIRAGIGPAAKLRGMIDTRRARRLSGARSAADAPAVVLFTSGSEGTPKGVVLSHRNLLANCAQLAAVLDFNPTDRVVNALPMFHSFGLTGGTLLPLLSGVPTFLYPSPLHYRLVPEMIYDRDATIVFGTDTFLNGWARFAHPYDFHTVRLIFAGAEKLRDETRRLYAERFGKGILEGYGATETAPVLCVNSSKRNRAGTVGRFLPGITRRIEPVAGIEDGAGRLWVRGPNVMLGYLRAEAPGVLQPPPEGWYDTGDIVSVDPEGFATIRGRAKRFAKIAGEMVSMGAAEALAEALWPDALHAVLALPDPRKGERLVLLTTRRDATVAALLAQARARGVPELMVPRELRVIERMPLLGTGKTDYPMAQRLLAGAPEPTMA